MSATLRLLYLSAALLLSSLPTTVWAQLIYQAESAQTSGGASVGSSGGVSYADNITQRGTATAPGSSVEFTSVQVSETRTYAVAFRYAAARPYASSLSIYVNGIDVTQALFPSTAAWATWATHTIPLNLRAGSNSIMVRYDADDNGWINLDYIQVKPESAGANNKLGAAPTAGWFPQEVSVDKFTGTAQVYVPLHTVQANGISVPIGLAYSATGVQVDDTGGKVGVNWSLTGGMSISREVRGLPDDRIQLSPNENRYGWLMYPAGNPNDKINAVPNAPTSFSATGCTADESSALQKLNEIGNLQHTTGTRNFYDSEPDIFYYSIPGHSGKFVFDAQRKAHTIPYDHIDISTASINATSGITEFIIRTADGTTYRFGMVERMEKKLVNVAASSNYFLREYQLYKLPNNAAFTYAYSWLVTSISTVAGGTGYNDKIEFQYRPGIQAANPSKSSRLYTRGAGSGSGVEEYETQSRVDKAWLETVTSQTTTQVKFNLVLADETEYVVQSVDVTSTAAPGRPLIRRYLFDYLNPEATITGSYDRKGNPLSEGPNLSRRFLNSIRVTNGCSTQPLYEFAYDQVSKVANDPLFPNRTKDVVALPLVGANDRDYWGFYTPNRSQTLIPQLYVYPQLLGQAQPVPAAPYRLFEVETSSVASGGFTLPGADRRPAAYHNFQQALAGTLTSLTLPGGGKALFEYEAHRFYDPVAQRSYPAGGTRIHAIRVQDPVTGLGARREYGYQESDGSASGAGRASGVLLRAPRFAFALPSTASPAQAQWTDATARCGEDLAEDPFEGRPIGYRQVSEQTTGKGQVVTVYHVPGGADESSAADGAAAGIAWSRATMGVARTEYYAPLSQTWNCPSVAPLQAGTDLYPFAPATNYDFRRGLPQSVSYKAEPVGSAAPAEVRRETFSYEYRPLKPTQTPIVGLAYEQLSSGNRNTYAYAKYSILTDFIYVIRHQREVMSNGSAASNQSDTWYNYNAQGWLAAQGKTNSDGKGYRTRYKYLTDYPVTGTAAEPRFEAMQQRFSSTGENISASPIETISEVVISPSEVRFAGATLNTFLPASQSIPTRPHQVLRWQPAGTLPLSSYDSTRVEATTGGLKLHVSSNFRVVTTLLETTDHLVPLSTRTEAGRQLSSVHLGYGGTTPVLTVANALASEVLFSDFESV
ncbi:MAG TPA: carbohydrate-binding protein, partial [Hymenobacter sp.]